MTNRLNFLGTFKATLALEALPGDKTVQEIAAKRQLHPTQVSRWKRQAFSPTRLKKLRTRTVRSKSSLSRCPAAHVCMCERTDWSVGGGE
jgi:transposase-like protein